MSVYFLAIYPWAQYVPIALVLLGLFVWQRRRNSVIALPSLGRETPILCTIDAYILMHNRPKYIKEYYSKYSAFKLPNLSHWLVMLNNSYVEEIINAQESVLSHHEFLIDIFAHNYTMGTATKWHHDVIRTSLTKNLGKLFSNMHNEVVESFRSCLKPDADGWTKIKAYPVLTKLVTRVNNRVLVGLPFCRDEKWTSFLIDYAGRIGIKGSIISFLPRFSRRFLGPLIGGADGTLRKCLTMIGPMIQEHMDLPEDERPNDLITWLLKDAPKEESSLEDIARKVMVVNFASIHNISWTLCHSLYWLLARPRYIEPLREEIDAAIKQYGWTKRAIDRRHKLDSFLKECIRVSPFTIDAFPRKTLVDYTFSDGLFIPAGTVIVSHSYAMQRDKSIWEDALLFNGFRFWNLREKEAASYQHRFVNTNRHLLTFGHGKHSCPGRFFAGNQLKAILSHLLLQYEVKWADPKLPKSGYRPPDHWVGSRCFPNQSTEIMIRKRA
ncbi:cytochrome P450 [Serendipita vermifera]|nr:cytochrome P450 [Serendipita vermifera]